MLVGRQREVLGKIVGAGGESLKGKIQDVERKVSLVESMEGVKGEDQERSQGSRCRDNITDDDLKDMFKVLKK